VYELSNGELAVAARDLNAHDLHQERLVRDIMSADKVEYEVAAEVMRGMFKVNRTGVYWLLPVPLEVGVVGFAGMSLLCFPLVFHFETAQAFADYLVASYDEVPEAGRWRMYGIANTATWSWAWMEPVSGSSFASPSPCLAKCSGCSS
jgi:hypothetical protein